MRFIALILWLILRFLNLWFFVIPARLTIIALVFYFLLIEWFIGDQPIYLFNRTLMAHGEWYKPLFWICFGYPLFWSFICSFAQSGNYGVKNRDTALKAAIQYRNGQMSITTPKKAFQIYKKTAVLDLIDSEHDDVIYDKVAQGFRSLHGNDPPQKIYKGFVEKD